MATAYPISPKRSPFKFLDPYDREDRHLFFGREKEIEELYEKTLLAKLILVYGASGTGKTSLIHCGLSNKFTPSDWFAIFIRKGEDIGQSLFRELREKAIEEIPEGASLQEAVESVYLDHFIPIYLIFDQFEELFIMGSQAEQQDFFDMLAQLLRSRVVCKVMIIIREEYLAYFSDFEATLPILFDNRYRVEAMQQSQLESVIKGTINSKEFKIDLQEDERTVGDILDNLRSETKRVDLTNLQVYLDRLYRREVLRSQEQGREAPLRFDPKLVQEVGKLPEVLSDFLDEQTEEIDKELNQKGLALEVLMALVTNEGTKRSMSLVSLQKLLAEKKGFAPEQVSRCIELLYERKILRELKI